MPSVTYRLFRKAILAKQQIVCTYHGRNRELCPHVLGTNKDGQEAVLAWQFAGQSGGALPEWRCLRLAEVASAQAREGSWHSGRAHRSQQRCITAIDVDVNVDRPKKPLVSE